MAKKLTNESGKIRKNKNDSIKKQNMPFPYRHGDPIYFPKKKF